MRYLALLRGINVGGKNKVAMAELRDCFEAQGFADVSTYINSGNIFFSSDETDEVKLVEVCEAAIECRGCTASFHGPCPIINAREQWW